jgi:hypothetical protein
MDDEKCMEIEALKSIFNEHFQEIDNTKFDLIIFPSIDTTNDAQVAVTMTVDIAGAYPAVPPKVALAPLKGKLNNMITTAQCNAFAEEVLNLSQQQLGMPHIHILAQYVQNKLAGLQEQLTSKGKHNDTTETHATKRRDDSERNSVSDSDSEYNDTNQLIPDGGTPVTVESFRLWKEKFDKELENNAIKNNYNNSNSTNARENTSNDIEKRLTGRQFFELNANKVDVDWELFATEHEELELRDVLKKEDFTALTLDDK